MDSEAFDKVVQRLEEIEFRLRQAVLRLEAIEASSQPRPEYPAPPPPPVYAEPPPRHPPPPYPQAATSVTPPAEQTEQRSAEEREFSIGAWLLPRLGATALIAGIGFFVALAIAEGWITPGMQFAGAVALCIGFITVGMLKLEERVEFGYLLVGIGSCGLYLTFAGGHLYQNLYSQHVMVGLFLALSLANLAFSFRRAAQSFLGIGVIGGFAAVLLPLQQSPDLVIPLHFAVVVPATLIAAKHRWNGWLAGIWLISSIPVIAYAFQNAPPWEYKLAYGYGSSVFQIAVMSICFARIRVGDDNEGVTEDSATFLILAVILTFIGGFALRMDPAHLAILAALLCLWSLVLRKDNIQRTRLPAAAILSFLVLAPATGNAYQAAQWYSVAAVACAVASLAPERSKAGLAGFGLWALSLSAYSLTASRNFDDVPIVLLVIAAGIVVTLAVRRAKSAPVEFTVAAAVIGAFLLSRLGILTLGDETWTLTIVWTIYAAALFAVGFILRIVELRYISLALFGLAALKVALVDVVIVSQEARVVVLMALGLAMLAAGYAYVRSKR